MGQCMICKTNQQILTPKTTSSPPDSEDRVKVDEIKAQRSNSGKKLRSLKRQLTALSIPVPKSFEVINKKSALSDEHSEKKKTDYIQLRALSIDDAEPKAEIPTEMKLIKYENPALVSLSIINGFTENLTHQTIVNLFPNLSPLYYSCGLLNDANQKAFDSKIEYQWKSNSFGQSISPLKIEHMCKKGLKPDGPNQDDFFILQTSSWGLYGVFDGHGVYGHIISNFVQKLLIFLIVTNELFETDPAYVIKEAFIKTNDILEGLSETTGSDIDCSLSGTTATILLHKDDKIHVAHVGDSRCVLASSVDSKLESSNLTSDHKPTRTDEKSRIESYGGEVRLLEGDFPYRVFARNRLYPGLAMSRALGDIIGAAFGVIATPEITQIDISNDMKFIVLATDGIWEFISSEEAVDLIQGNSQNAAGSLVHKAWKRWIEEEENVVDDITCIVIRMP